MISLFLPSPPISEFHIGPVTVHIYALCMLAGIVLAWWLASRRYVARGGKREDFESMALWVVVIGIVGARAYHVMTDPELYFAPGRHPIDALKIWNGGLGIWGAVAAGAVTGLIWCRRHGVRFGAVADCIAPALLFAQAIGRLGNWFNQELFGRPSTAPWALMIDPQHRPAGYQQYATFHPTFLYELIWCTIGGFVLLWLERRFSLGRGKLFTSYVLYYCFGRFFIEALRIDPANHLGGLRINNYTSAIIFAVAACVFGWQLWRIPGRSPSVWVDGAPKESTKQDKTSIIQDGSSAAEGRHE
ncbi:prolipoprotein diacylglyceryl transferase [Propionibacterium cyclohexanicum]|uniref:Phosphatidylglycerol--prolipoprotein diacylglyceryl transferase n=1 Tax=Propionibacterium cyclohexanicum TaxID=64702 RepID=A0A1H9Q4A7_9ACTN|nr:prolipoprotein diacylglyceryl transferase [Propionibacterium cyclohexanicum]SER55270.1 prolipoprotein diacylglyceryl transferase [Propionibacterium cyclohexanicum]